MIQILYFPPVSNVNCTRVYWCMHQLKQWTSTQLNWSSGSVSVGLGQLSHFVKGQSYMSLTVPRSLPVEPHKAVAEVSQQETYRRGWFVVNQGWQSKATNGSKCAWSGYLSDYLSICLSACLSIYLSLCRSICPSVHLAIYLCSYLSIYSSI